MGQREIHSVFVNLNDDRHLHLHLGLSRYCDISGRTRLPGQDSSLHVPIWHLCLMLLFSLSWVAFTQARPFQGSNSPAASTGTKPTVLAERSSNDQDATPQGFSSESVEFFENHIRPLLVEHCLECHGQQADKVRGGLWLTSRQQMLQGGDSGPAIVPFKPAESLIVQAVHYADFEMPPRGKLPLEQIALLEKWIKLGAPDPRQPDAASRRSEPQIDIESGRQFWSFQPLAPLATPRSPGAGVASDSTATWPQSEIDHFIFDALQDVGLQPVEDADRFLLLRRIHFALTGLPPTLEQIDAFCQSDQAVEDDLARVIDELLESPRFGERWGRHWLDVARFAESSGGGRSLMFPEAWRYRDYVIDALNQDKPFDQMIVEQIAGDLLPYTSQQQRNEQLTATGFLALGPINYEQQDKERLRMEVVDEQVDTVGRAFLALTLGCARCHDHKFDPIPTRDYYALAGIFGSTVSLVDGNVSGYVTQSLATREDEQAFQAYRQKLKRLQTELAANERNIKKLGGDPRRVDRGPGDSRIVRLEDLKGIVLDNRDAKLTGSWTDSNHIAQYVGQGYIHDRGQPKGANRASFAPRLEQGGRYEVRLAYSPGANRASNTRVTIDHQDGRTIRAVNQTRRPPIDGLFVSLGIFRFEADNLATVTVDNTEADGVVIADAVQFLPRDLSETNSNSLRTKNQKQSGLGFKASQKPSQQKRDASSAALPERSAEMSQPLQLAIATRRKLMKQLTQLKSSPPRPIAKAMSVRESQHPTDGQIHIRGSVRNLGEIVPRGFLQVVTPPSSWPRIPATASGRLQLAQWIASPQNPLTARVYANRVWRHLMGVGLVESTDNFGKMGRQPSHPELLDYLANRLIQNGWSTKQLIREIMLSRVYRLSARRDAKAYNIDPENRLLWRAHRRRMDAEVLRDSILQVAGQLDLTAGGLTIRKLEQYDLGYQFNSRRRSVYVPAFRNSMLGLFEVFDIANPNLVVGNRTTSTLPTQALFLMNNPWVHDQAAAIATRICEQTPEDSKRLRSAYLQLLGRPPSKPEIRLSLEFLQSEDRSSEHESPTISQAAWKQLIHSLIGSLDFRYIH